MEQLRGARQEAEAEKEAQQRNDALEAERNAKLFEEIALQNHLAQASRQNRRRGAGEAVQAAGYQEDRNREPDVQAEALEKELSKGQARRLRQQANRAQRAAAQKKAAEVEATQQFLRETQGFVTDKELPEPTALKKKEPKSKAPKELAAHNQIAEDLLVGLWEAKHKHAGEASENGALSLSAPWRPTACSSGGKSWSSLMRLWKHLSLPPGRFG